jgi:enoyl-CoA hydratase/carnithine racemase
MSDLDSEVRAGGDIIFRVDDGAAILQLNRPAKRNALSQAMWEAIRAALAEAADHPDVRAFVFTGLPGVFCAGADLTALKSRDREAAALYREISLRGYDAVRDFSLPTIAVIDGLCIGAATIWLWPATSGWPARARASPSRLYGTASSMSARPSPAWSS